MSAGSSDALGIEPEDDINDAEVVPGIHIRALDYAPFAGEAFFGEGRCGKDHALTARSRATLLRSGRSGIS